MTSLQRSAVSFRRQGSSGRIWSDQSILDQKNGAILQNQEQTCQQSGSTSNDLEEKIPSRKSSSSSSSSSSPPLYFSEIRRGPDISSSTRNKPGCGLSSLFRQCIGSSARA
ncbi:hypothetical protein ARALYDRAFT_896128 [Arabidopsis lyrata subsp. lyrata]|uniref:Uncharacterized protein n=1 Tax=Arabidopsis lyrata subsp. lyrata TaxID=81972 RepID=D7LAG7_ARALL|nr:hypothetical protein ARALYDRAFT_896128 [Arabidopsis lyrata subsp. lyrata]